MYHPTTPPDPHWLRHPSFSPPCTDGHGQKQAHLPLFCSLHINTARSASIACVLLLPCADGHGQKQLNCLFTGPGAKPLHNEAASSQASFANLHMNGQEVFKFAVKAVPSVGA